MTETPEACLHPHQPGTFIMFETTLHTLAQQNEDPACNVAFCSLMPPNILFVIKV